MGGESSRLLKPEGESGRIGATHGLRIPAMMPVSWELPVASIGLWVAPVSRAYGRCCPPSPGFPPRVPPFARVAFTGVVASGPGVVTWAGGCLAASPQATGARGYLGFFGNSSPIASKVRSTNAWPPSGPIMLTSTSAL